MSATVNSTQLRKQVLAGQRSQTGVRSKLSDGVVYGVEIKTVWQPHLWFSEVNLLLP